MTDTPKPIQFQCPPALHAALKKLADKNNRRVQAEIIEILSRHLKLPVEYNPPGRRWPKKD